MIAPGHIVAVHTGRIARLDNAGRGGTVEPLSTLPGLTRSWQINAANVLAAQRG
jgi:hypothetical protein